MRDSKLFDKVVTQFFDPIARRLGLPLFKVSNAIYEIPSPFFIMRIRLDSGHARGLNVILRQASLSHFVDNKAGIQLGIWCFPLFAGEQIKGTFSAIDTDEDFLKLAKLFAETADRFGVPYLLGQKNDFEAVKEFMKKRGELELERINEMTRNIKHNLPFVRQEWPVVIPPEKGEKRIAAQEIKIQNIRFLGEQIGQKEQILKEKLGELFSRDKSIKSAYLARIIGLENPAGAALCLYSESGSDKEIIKKVGIISTSVLNSEEFLDLIFVTDKQETFLAKICQPFFKLAA